MTALPRLLPALALVLCAGPALAEKPATVTVHDTFDNVTFAVQQAITNAGLVVDSHDTPGEMLARTGKDVGSDKVLFTHADVFTFCSAVVSRQVMEADPMNLQYCPYHIFVAELPDRPGEVVVGHEVYPPGVTDKINQLLDAIIKDATSN